VKNQKYIEFHNDVIIEFKSIHSTEEKAPKTFSHPFSKPIRPL